MVTRQMKQKLEDGTEITVDIGAKAENVVTDSEHRFVSDAEKAAWGKAASGDYAEKQDLEEVRELAQTAKTTAEQATTAITKTEVQVTLSADSWTGTEAPYEYTIDHEAVTADSVIRITFPPDVTLEQAEAFGKALVTGGTQTVGSFTLRALKAKPTVDVPVIVSIGGA